MHWDDRDTGEGLEWDGCSGGIVFGNGDKWNCSLIGIGDRDVDKDGEWEWEREGEGMLAPFTRGWKSDPQLGNLVYRQ